jgi:hypothetical protein
MNMAPVPMLRFVVHWFVRSGTNHSRNSKISIYSRCTRPKTTTTTTASKRKGEQWNAQTVTGGRSSRSRGSAGVGVVRQRHGFGGASRRWQRPFSRSGLGLGMSVGNWLRGSPRTASPGPHLPFIALCDGGPPTISGWAPPIRA